MTDRLNAFKNANEINIDLIAFQKIGKNTRGRLELLTSIFDSLPAKLSLVDFMVTSHTPNFVNKMA